MLVYIKWEYDVMSIGQLIKTERIRKHFTQKDIAIKLNVSEQYISLVETNKRISYKMLLAVLKELNLIIGVE